MDQDWIRLVKDARKNNKGFEKLLVELEPVLITAAIRLGGGRPLRIDELMQSARIRIWKSLGKIKLDRPDTIRGFLVIIGVNAMRDDVRLRVRRLMFERGDVDWQNLSAAVVSKGLFKGLLLQYEKYIKRTGGFSGAHKYFAKKYGISLWMARLRFHRAVKTYLKELDQ